MLNFWRLDNLISEQLLFLMCAAIEEISATQNPVKLYTSDISEIFNNLNGKFLGPKLLTYSGGRSTYLVMIFSMYN